EAGKLHLENRPFQIEDLLADLALILSANVGARPLQLLFDVDPALPSTVVGDALRMRQVLVNLCGNAIKFTERGEVVLSVERVSSSAGRVQVRFAVQDTGIGIAPENRSRIFDGFTQAEATTTRRFGGTGLGLSISKRLVELMGGELQLQSRLGEGSCFHFSLDLGVVDSPPASLAPDAPPALSGSRVLLIEPHDKAREMLLRMGRSLGWDVHAVTDARQALALLGAGSGAAWQLVLADALLPAQSGWAGFEPLAAALPLPRPALLVRASADEHQRLSAQSALNQGPIDGFLFKPCTAAMCLSAARQALHARVERSQGRAPEQLPLRLAGLRLLVVEDNATNQQVARELLQAEGAEVQLAWDGQQALEALSGDRLDFDLVLMDLQMPVMDGHTATRLIRHQLGWSAERLPIVAMTANALAADRAACLDAGMNDHIGKPFDVDALVALIVRLAGRANAPQPTGMALAPAPAVPRFSPALLQAAEAAGVALPQAIGRLGGDRALYEQVLQQFCVALAAVPDELQRDATRLDAAAGRRRLHTLKGLAATAGAHDVAEAAGQAERALPHESASDGAASHAVLADLARHWVAQAAATASALSDLVHALASERQLLGPMEHGAARTRHAPSARHASLAAALGVLAEQLDHADMAATDTLSAMQAQFAPLPPGLLGPLAAAMDALDFSTARICCSQLLALEGLDQQAALADACVLVDD
ncbi:response regulator, partial [Ideonella sp.]|uniref:hybrid sensor histidine kinase/response regulator n=1 Tax=Ideonella sp. TaxID=1929293 RepID=UPI003BB69EDA